MTFLYITLKCLKCATAFFRLLFIWPLNYSKADWYIGTRMDYYAQNGIRLHTCEYRPANGRKSAL